MSSVVAPAFPHPPGASGVTALIAMFHPFKEWTYCARGCGQLVSDRHAVAVWENGTPLGFAHDGECPT